MSGILSFLKNPPLLHFLQLLFLYAALFVLWKLCSRFSGDAPQQRKCPSRWRLRRVRPRGPPDKLIDVWRTRYLLKPQACCFKPLSARATRVEGRESSTRWKQIDNVHMCLVGFASICIALHVSFHPFVQ
jgi:hypothetical protein